MTMTLTELLQIKERYLEVPDLRSLAYCEGRWREEGRPAKRWELFHFIEKMLRELQANGTGYPKVLLLRKKEIQRGAFSPPEVSQRADPDVCPLCKGSSWQEVKYPNAASSYRPCSCATAATNPK
jgi:hypothetical protein